MKMRNYSGLLKMFYCALFIIGLPTVQTSKEAVIVVVISDVMAVNNQNIVPIFKEIVNHVQTNKDRARLRFAPVVASDNLTQTFNTVCDMFASGVIGLIDISSPKLSPLFQSLCTDLGVAYISMVDHSYYNHYMADRFLSNGTNLSIEPVGVQMLQVVADLADKEQLNSVALFYDETFDIQNTPRRVLTNVPVPHIYLHLSSNTSQTEQQLDTLIKINIKTILIIADRFNAQSFLSLDAKLHCPSCQGTLRVLLITAKQATDPQLQFIDFMHVSRIDTGLEADQIKVDEAFSYDVAKLVINAFSYLADQEVQVRNLELDCYNNNITLDSSPSHGVQSQQLLSAVIQVGISGVFGMLSWEPSDSVVKYNMTLMVEEVVFEDDSQSSKGKVAEWTQSGHLWLSAEPLIKLDKRKRYRVVTIPGIPPFVYRNNGSKAVEYSGFCIDFLVQIAENLGFDYDIYETDQVGAMDESGSWSGAIRELIDGRADIAVGPISVMNERESVIDFTVPFYDLVGLTILMKKPKVDYSLVKFLSVMDEEVWGCIIGAFVLFSVLICIFDRLSPFSYQNRKSQWRGEGEEPRIFTLKEGIWFCMMSLTPQGGGETPKALSGRLIAATWWLFGFIIIATYTANLAAFLTVSRLETPIESLDDLSKQFKVQYAPKNGSMAMIYFRRMADIETMFYEIWKNMTLMNDNMGALERAQLAVWDYPVSDKYTRLWDAMKKTTFPATLEAAIQRVVNEDFAFISESTTNKYQSLINCDVVEVGEEFSRKPYALAIREGSPLKNELNNAILKLINNRALEELKTKWWSRDAKACPQVEDESDGISIRNIGGVFLVIVIGSALSLITLAFECYWYRIRPQRRKEGSTNPNNHSKPSWSETSLNSGYDRANERVKKNSNGESDIHPGDIKTQPKATETYPGATETHPGATEIHPGATETHPDATETHPGATDVLSVNLGITNSGFDSTESFVVTEVIDREDIFTDRQEVFPDKQEAISDRQEVFTDSQEAISDRQEVFTDRQESISDRQEVFTARQEAFTDVTLTANIQYERL